MRQRSPLLAVAKVAVVGAHRRPLAQLLDLVTLIKLARVLVLGRDQAHEFQLRFDQAGLRSTLLAVDAEVRVDMRFAIFRSPPRAARRGEGDRHPDFAEILAVALQRGRIGKIVPFEEVSRPKHVIEHQRRGVRRAFEAIRHRRRQAEAEEILVSIRHALRRARIARMMREQRPRQHGRRRWRDLVIDLRKRPRDQRRREARAEVLGRAACR